MAQKRFDPSQLDELIEVEKEGESGLIEDLINDYRGSLEQSLASIAKAGSSEDFATLERLTHALKSSSKLLGLGVAAEICQQMEDSANRGVFETNQMETLKSELRSALDELIQFDANRRAA